MRLSILELHFHLDSLDGMIKIFENSSYEVDVFTTTANLNLLQGINYASNIKFHEYRGGSRYIYIKKNKEVLEQSDIIFVNTIATNFGAYLALPKNKIKILRVHNINKQFNPNRSIYWPNNLLTLWKFSSYFGRQIVLKAFPITRVKINKFFNYFTFPDDGLKNYVLQKNYLKPEQVLYSIPLKIAEKGLKVPPFEDCIHLTIIGGTDPKRRNYTPVLEGLSELISQAKHKFHLTLLGKTSGEFGHKVLTQLNKLRQENFDFTYFSTNVSEDEFKQVMNNTHLVISPIIESARAEIYHEYYGKTKTTGSILDFMKFGIITLTPNYYSPPTEMKDYILQYSSPIDFAAILNQFDKNPDKLIALNQKSKTFVQEQFSKELIFEKSDSTFKEIISRHA